MPRTNLLPLLLALGLAAGAVPAQAEDVTTGRYTSVRAEPTPAQADPLEVMVSTRLPAHVHRVGEAIDYLLLRSGYRRADTLATDRAAQALFALPLPEVHRQIGPLRLRAVLETLAGRAYALVVDPVHRRVSFDLKTAYRLSLSQADTESRHD